MHHHKANKNMLAGAKGKDKTGWIMAIYLFGLFIGALSTGSITPVRTIIQNSFGADDQLGIWMITIFTLCYAAIIPVSGKLADRMGRKIVFIFSILLFGVGSIICGISGNFILFLVGRAVQAIGAGGIMPIATAEFGTSFPEEKRGMALGMVGGVYGIANVLGATFGSAVLDIFGQTEWQWIFLINIPLCILIIIGGLVFIPNHKSEQVYRIDKIGTLLMTVIILSLLYGLKNIDFFDFLASLTHRDVWPFLLFGAALIPFFVLVEKKAEDPIFHIEYMKNSQIMVTLGCGLLAGCSMMGMIFIPQFAENCMKIPSGDGGYFVIILGLMAGAVSPISGKLIDKFGSKPVLGSGFVVSIIGSLYLAFVTINHINIVNVVICLLLIGLGLGLIMGTPLNYMMLRHTKDEDSNSALATLSLIRSIGTAIAPAIMVGFIAQAGATMQDEIMKEMPDIPNVPKLEQQIELQSIVDQLKNDEDFQEQMGDTDLDEMLNMDMDMDMDMTSDSDMELPDDLLKELQDSDVTTITKSSKHMASYMFDQFTPDVISEIQDGIGEGIDGISEGINGVGTGVSGIKDGISGITDGQAGIRKGIAGITKGINGMQSGIDSINGQIKTMKNKLAKLKKDRSEMQAAISGVNTGINALQEQIEKMEGAIAGMNAQLSDLQKEYDDPETTEEGKQELEGQIEELKKAIAGQTAAVNQMSDKKKEYEDQLPGMQAALDGMDKGIGGMESAIKGMNEGKNKLLKKQSNAKNSRKEMQSAISQMEAAKKKMYDAIAEMMSKQEQMVRARELMVSMREDIPGLFDDVEKQYLKEIDRNSDKIEGVYQRTLNHGFRNMFICVAVFNLIGLLLLLIYRDDRRKEDDE
ncbi:MAG: MFS transporter [Clostridia bacterium]|nr:MFS transporter [Clostridia bacterium]